MNHIKKLAISIPQILMASFLILITFNNANAYTFTEDFRKGFYWKSFPIQMAKYSTNQTEASMLESLVNQSVAEWESVIGKDIWNFSKIQSTTQYAGNHIRWSYNFGEETGYDPNRTLAITIRYNAGTFFERTVIILNGNIDYLRQNWGNSLKATILHEIGHTLGLDHSEDPSALMYASLGQASSVQSDDVRGINAVVDETLRRQSIGYTSPYSTREEKVAACGSIALVNSNGDGPKGGTKNFILSLMLGVMLTALVGKRKNKSVVKFEKL